MHTGFENARISFAVRRYALVIQHAYDLIKMNNRRRPGQSIAPLDATLRLHEAGLIENPHKLPGVRDRDAFPSGYLRKRQRLTLRIRTSELKQTAQPIFFLCRYLHKDF